MNSDCANCGEAITKCLGRRPRYCAEALGWFHDLTSDHECTGEVKHAPDAKKATNETP